MSESVVETARPPMTTVPSGDCVWLPASIPSAMGIMPPMVAHVVMRIGRRRIGAACSTASRALIPRSRSWLLNSTTRIAFFTTIPTSISTPIKAVSPNAIGVKGCRKIASPASQIRLRKKMPKTTPAEASGTVIMMTSGCSTDSNCEASSM